MHDMLGRGLARTWDKRKLEDERHKLVEKALKSIPDYHPPSDYRRPAKTQEKVYVPVNDYPEINFSKILTLTSILVRSTKVDSGRFLTYSSFSLFGVFGLPLSWKHPTYLATT